MFRKLAAIDGKRLISLNETLNHPSQDTLLWCIWEKSNGVAYPLGNGSLIEKRGKTIFVVENLQLQLRNNQLDNPVEHPKIIKITELLLTAGDIVDEFRMAIPSPDNLWLQKFDNNWLGMWEGKKPELTWQNLPEDEEESREHKYAVKWDRVQTTVWETVADFTLTNEMPFEVTGFDRVIVRCLRGADDLSPKSLVTHKVYVVNASRKQGNGEANIEFITHPIDLDGYLVPTK